MPEAFSTPNLVPLPITSQELGRGAFLPPPTKIVLSNSPTTIGLRIIQPCPNMTRGPWDEVENKTLQFLGLAKFVVKLPAAFLVHLF